MASASAPSEATHLVNSAHGSSEAVVETTEFRLCGHEHVPPWLRSPDIHGWYRVHFSLGLCLRSLLRWHNELTNIHTHLLGAVGFLGFYVYLLLSTLRFMRSQVHFIIITAYTLAVTWLLLCSASFHTFGCRSPASYACVARLDYSGIGLVILTSQWGAMTYAFMCWWEAFVGFAVVLSVFTVLVVVGPMFKQFHHKSLRLWRALLYVVLSLVFPLAWWLMLATRYGFGVQAIVSEFYMGMALCYLGYGCGVFFYVTRFPEKLFPGRFDLCPSHTFWHLGVLAGAALLLRSFVSMAASIGDRPCADLLNSTWYR